MGITIPDNIPFPDAGSALPPLETHFAALAEGAQQAINGLRSATSPAVATAAARNTLYPSPAQGDSVWRLDRGYEEVYYGEYSAGVNPGGATPAGWYPVSGAMPFATIFRSGFAVGVPNNTWFSVSANQNWSGGSRSADFTAYNDGWTIPITGLWDIEVAAALVTVANSALTLSLNGTSVTTANQLITATGAAANGPAIPTVRAQLNLSANDILRPFLMQASGSTVPWATTGTGVRPEVNGRQTLRYLGPTR